MLEPLSVRVELWPLAADDIAIHVLDDEPWLSDPIPADNTVQSEVDTMLWLRGYRVNEAPAPSSAPLVLCTHSTSWRQAGPHVYLTWAAIVAVGPGQYARDLSSTARPVSAPLTAVYPQPAPHGPTRSPATTRHSDVLLHLLRHLAYLGVTDDELAPILDARWRRHLAALDPVLGRLYRRAG